MTYVPKLAAVILVASSLFGSVWPAQSADKTLGSISGMVTNSGTKLGIGYANVIVLGTRKGVQTRETGRFRIADLQPGTYTIRAGMLLYESASVQAQVRAGVETDLRLELRARGLSAAAAARESIGIDTHIDTQDVACEIRTDRPKFRVGESAGFKVRIHNRARHSLWLVRSLDGSGHGRYPHVSLQVEGPAGGFAVPGLVGCANVNDLHESDFVLVGAGETFDPFDGGFLPANIHYGRFSKPGTYVATFRYSTNETDVRKWLGWPPPRMLSNSISQRLRGVPIVDLGCSVEFVVQP
jgi:hypothetical protein